MALRKGVSQSGEPHAESAAVDTSNHTPVTSPDRCHMLDGTRHWQVRFAETAEKVRRERLLPRSLPPLVGRRVHLQPGGTHRDSATTASLRRLVSALGAKASSTLAYWCCIKRARIAHGLVVAIPCDA